jgi:AcrR family transcriptional regulator
MSAKLLNKHQVRTQETRARLLNAAEEVFVRDGYEGAQLAEIASAAGRTKGAVYAHFKSKEDLFLALFEHRTRQYVDRLLGTLARCANRKQRMQEFRSFYVELAHDKTWPILELEFKLFSLRHPDSKERLRKAFEMTVPTNDETLWRQMFGSLSKEQKADVHLSILALGPIVSGLILESYMEPENLSEKAMRRILGKVFDALISAPI